MRVEMGGAPSPRGAIERVVVHTGTYYDSVTLMLASRDAQEGATVLEAAAMAATPPNVELLARRGFLPPAGLGPDDLVVAVRAETEEAADLALAVIERALAARGEPTSAPAARPPSHSLTSAARRDPELSLAFVSLPGHHIAHEVAAALEAGLHVFCFSSGLSVEQEASLKHRALERNLLLMGPDCGTAILDGVGLGFANVLGRGPVGLVGASGTGLQEVGCLLDAAGIGVSHAVGVGGRDLNATVGGLMARRALQLLAQDEETEVIALISKPPDPRVAQDVRASAEATGKPVVLGFLGRRSGDSSGLVREAASLEETARVAAEMAGGRIPRPEPDASPKRTPGYLRGLFCGGSLCYEAMGVVSGAVGEVASNIPLRPAWLLDGEAESRGHTFVDFGDERLVEGRAHPMIDPTLRNERFEREARAPEVGVILLDLVLGLGAHPNPAGELAPLVQRAIRDRPGDLSVVVSVCGTAGDPQGMDRQEATLRGSGAVVTRGVAHAARLALDAAGLGGAP